jgi:hypothetical protein
LPDQFVLIYIPLRRVLSVLSPEVVSVTNEKAFLKLGDDEISGEVDRISLKKRKKSKGFDGEVNEVSVNAEASLCMMPLKDIQRSFFSLFLRSNFSS